MADNFDPYAKEYREIHDRNLKFAEGGSIYFAEYKIKELTRFEKNESLDVLDVGCGDGLSAWFMRRYFPQWSLQGADISSESIERAREKKIERARFFVFDGATLPFPENSFDLLFLSGVLHHISFSKHLAFLQELFRVLKAGGRLYLFEHNPYNPLTRYLVKTCIFDQHAKLLFPFYARKILAESGFSQIRKRFTIFIPPTRILRGLLKIEKHLGWLPLGGQYYFRALKP